MQKKMLSLALLLIGLVVTLTINSAFAPPVAYNVGDVFAGVGTGRIKHFDNTGVLLDTLNTGTGSSEDTGMAFDAAGNLYSTEFSVGTMSKFDNMGNLLVNPWGGPFSTHPESVVVDAAGNLYSGEVDGANMLRKWDPAGNPLGTWSPATESRGIDWIDLAADQTTMFYTSEGWFIKRFDVGTNTQLADFNAAPLPSRPAYALRIRSNGEVLVAATSDVHRLNAAGAVIQSYPTANYNETSFFFALNLDPDGTSFWTAGYHSGQIYRIDIITGNLITTFNGGILGPSLAGLAIYGEPTVGQVIPEYPFGTFVGLIASFVALVVFVKYKRFAPGKTL